MPPGLPARLPRVGWVCSVAAGVEKLLAPGPRAARPRLAHRRSRAGGGDRPVRRRDGVAPCALARAVRGAAARRATGRAGRCRSRATRVGVLGTGAMGGEIAVWLERCGLVVRGWNRRSPRTVRGAARGERDRRLRLAADRARPRASSTHARSPQMPRGAYVINVARGAHVVEPDLIAAVRSGHLAGAALDVQRREPLPADDPLWSVPGITITPHIAAQPSTETVADQFVAARARAAARRAAAQRSRPRRAATESEKRPQRGRPLPLGGRGAKRGGSSPVPQGV